MEIHSDSTSHQLFSRQIAGKTIKTSATMATTRRKTSGFSDLIAETESTEDTTTFEDLLESAQEEPEQEVVAEVPEVKPAPPVAVAPRPFVEEKITPSDDAGPRFAEETPPPAPRKAPALEPKPKRHPRNVPRFSRTR
jgi:hypothetical protein